MKRYKKIVMMLGLAVGVAAYGSAAMSGTTQAAHKSEARPAGGKGASASPSDGAYVHVVVMAMKKGTPPEAIEQFIKDGYRLLEPRKTVRHFAIGRPANPGSGDMETNYEVAMLVTYDEYKDFENSLADPLHAEYDARNLQWVENFRVFDFVDDRYKTRDAKAAK